MRYPVKHKRVLYVHGTHEDEGVYFRCWNCGFICDSTRDQVGDGTGAITSAYSDVESDYSHVGATYTVTSSIRDIKVPKVSSGCPLCGCRNYR